MRISSGIHFLRGFGGYMYGHKINATPHFSMWENIFGDSMVSHNVYSSLYKVPQGTKLYFAFPYVRLKREISNIWSTQIDSYLINKPLLLKHFLAEDGKPSKAVVNYAKAMQNALGFPELTNADFAYVYPDWLQMSALQYLIWCVLSRSIGQIVYQNTYEYYGYPERGFINDRVTPKYTVLYPFCIYHYGSFFVFESTGKAICGVSPRWATGFSFAQECSGYSMIKGLSLPDFSFDFSAMDSYDIDKYFKIDDKEPLKVFYSASGDEIRWSGCGMTPFVGTGGLNYSNMVVGGSSLPRSPSLPDTWWPEASMDDTVFLTPTKKLSCPGSQVVIDTKYSDLVVGAFSDDGCWGIVQQSDPKQVNRYSGVDCDRPPLQRIRAKRW